MKYKNLGFSLVEIVIVIFIVSVVGSVGYYVWNKNETPKPIDQANNTQTDKNDMAVNTSDSGVNIEASTEEGSESSTNQLVSKNNKFSMSVPDGWVMTNDTELDYAHAFGLDNITYTKGKTPTIITTLGHRGGGPTGASFSMQYGSFDNLNGYYNYSKETGTITTDSGLVGKTYEYTVTEENVENSVVGTISYGFKFVDSEGVLVATYQKLPEDPDQLDIVLKAIKTIKLQ